MQKRPITTIKIYTAQHKFNPYANCALCFYIYDCSSKRLVLCARFIILEYKLQNFNFFKKMPQNNKAPKRKESFLTYLRLSCKGLHTTQNALFEHILSFVCFFFMKVNSPVTSCTCKCCKKTCYKGKKWTHLFSIIHLIAWNKQIICKYSCLFLCFWLWKV